MDTDCNNEQILFNDNKIKGKINTTMPVEKCLKLGAVFGKTISNENTPFTAAVGFMGNSSTHFVSLSFITGLISYNINCLNVGECLLGQLLYSGKQLSADYNIFIYQNNNDLTFYFFDNTGMPLQSDNMTAIKSVFENDTFTYKNYNNFGNFINANKIKELYKTDMYNYLLKSDNNISASVISNNKALELFANEILEKIKIDTKGTDITVFLTETGDDFSFSQNNMFLNKDTLFLFLCKYEVQNGNKLALDENTLPFLEVCTDTEFIDNIIRISDNTLNEDTLTILKNTPFITDSFLAMLRILSIIKKENYKLKDIISFIKYSVAYKEISVSENKAGIYKKFNITPLNHENGFISFGKNNIFIKEMPSENKLLVVAKSYTEEFAEEILNKFILLLKE